METDEKPLVQTAAYLAKSVVYNNKERLMASLMVAGWDSQKGGQVYVVPISGMIVRKSIYISGSGSIYAMGYLDANFRPGMSKEECLQLAINGVAMAIARDGSSGGCIRYAIVTEQGVEKRVILNTEIPRYFEQ
jgi:20S proteasome subunit beta 1